MNALDSLLAGGSASLTATIAPVVTTGIDPMITQVWIPIVAAVFVPYLKDLAAIHIRYIKSRLAKRKTAKKD